ncbi:MAG: putative lipoprotein [Myxococcales bacterium]|nr:putative lipoprotein [Myxococcales bacterium]
MGMTGRETRTAFALLALASCIDSGPGPQGKKIEPSYVSANLLTAVPPEVTRLDVDLGGKVVYIGNTVDRTSVAPGSAVKITHYWQVKAPLGTGWRVFGFMRGAPAMPDFMNLDATDMEIGHPTQSWKPGQIIKDVQDVILRPDWRSPLATLYVGLIHVGGHDVGDRIAASGPNVVDRAITARTFEIDLSRAPPPIGTIHIPHATSPITVDGVAAEPAWSGAVTSPEFVTGEGCPDPIGRATARMTWDEQNLYLFVQVTDTDILSPYKQHDDPLWKADDVEIFIDADGNRHGYVELQVNPNNATFDSWFATTRAVPGDEKWDSHMVTMVKLRGTTESGDTDQGWDAEIAIPWAAVKGRDDAMAVRLPPQIGDRWRLNVVRVDWKTGSKDQSASTWNRITCGDFHALDRMLTAVFADSTGLIVPKPPDSDSGSAAGSGTGTGTGSGPATWTATGAASGSANDIKTNAPGLPPMMMQPNMIPAITPTPQGSAAQPTTQGSGAAMQQGSAATARPPTTQGSGAATPRGPTQQGSGAATPRGPAPDPKARTTPPPNVKPAAPSPGSAVP